MIREPSSPSGKCDFTSETFTENEVRQELINRNGKSIAIVDSRSYSPQVSTFPEADHNSSTKSTQGALLARAVSSNDSLKEPDKKQFDDCREGLMRAIKKACSIEHLTENQRAELSKILIREQLPEIHKFPSVDILYMQLRTLDHPGTHSVSLTLLSQIKERVHTAMGLEDSASHSDLEAKYKECLALLFTFSNVSQENVHSLTVQTAECIRLLANLREVWKEIPQCEWNMTKVSSEASVPSEFEMVKPERVKSLFSDLEKPNEGTIEPTILTTDHNKPLNDLQKKMEDARELIKQLSLTSPQAFDPQVCKMEYTENPGHQGHAKGEENIVDCAVEHELSRLISHFPTPPEIMFENEEGVKALTTIPIQFTTPDYSQQRGIEAQEQGLYNPERCITPVTSVAEQPLLSPEMTTLNSEKEMILSVTCGQGAKRKTRRPQAKVLTSSQQHSAIRDQKTLSARLVENLSAYDHDFDSRKNKLVAYAWPRSQNEATETPVDGKTVKEAAWSAAAAGIWPAGIYHSLVHSAQKIDREFYDLYYELTNRIAFEHGISPASRKMKDSVLEDPTSCEFIPYFDIAPYEMNGQLGTVFSLPPDILPSEAILEAPKMGPMLCDLFHIFQLGLYKTCLELYGEKYFDYYFGHDISNKKPARLLLSSVLGGLDGFMVNPLYNFLKPRNGGSIRVGDIIFFPGGYRSKFDEIKGFIDSPPPIAAVCSKKEGTTIKYSIPGRWTDFALDLPTPVPAHYRVFYMDFKLLEDARRRCEKHLDTPFQRIEATREKSLPPQRVHRQRRKPLNLPVKETVRDVKVRESNTPPQNAKESIIKKMEKSLTTLNQELRKINKGNSEDTENINKAYLQLKTAFTSFESSSELDDDTIKKWKPKISAALNAAEKHLR